MLPPWLSLKCNCLSANEDIHFLQKKCSGISKCCCWKAQRKRALEAFLWRRTSRGNRGSSCSASRWASQYQEPVHYSTGGGTLSADSNRGICNLPPYSQSTPSCHWQLTVPQTRTNPAWIPQRLADVAPSLWSFHTLSLPRFPSLNSVFCCGDLWKAVFPSSFLTSLLSIFQSSLSLISLVPEEGTKLNGCALTNSIPIKALLHGRWIKLWDYSHPQGPWHTQPVLLHKPTHGYTRSPWFSDLFP